MARTPIFSAVYRALTRRTEKLESAPLGQRVDFLERKYGSLSAASRATGVSRSTLRRWRDGQARPKSDSQRKMTRAIREALVPAGRRARVGQSTHPTAAPRTSRGEGGGGMTITAVVRISDDERERTLRIGQHVSDDVGNRILSAFLDGDDAALNQTMNEAISEYFGSDSWEIQSVSDVSFTPVR